MARLSGTGSVILEGRNEVAGFQWVGTTKIITKYLNWIHHNKFWMNGDAIVGHTNIDGSANLIHDNEFENNGYMVNSLATGRKMDNTAIHHNTSYATRGIRVAASRIVITGNTIRTWVGEAIIVEGSAGEGTHCVITDNICDRGGIRVTEVTDWEAPPIIANNSILEPIDHHGIHLVNCTGVSVHHNTITGLFFFPSATYDGIHFEGGSRCKADHNTITAQSDIFGGTMRYGINGASGSDHIAVGNNLGDPGGYTHDAVGGTLVLSYPGHATYGDNFTQ